MRRHARLNSRPIHHIDAAQTPTTTAQNNNSRPRCCDHHHVDDHPFLHPVDPPGKIRSNPKRERAPLTSTHRLDILAAAILSVDTFLVPITASGGGGGGGATYSRGVHGQQTLGGSGRLAGLGSAATAHRRTARRVGRCLGELFGLGRRRFGRRRRPRRPTCGLSAQQTGCSAARTQLPAAQHAAAAAAAQAARAQETCTLAEGGGGVAGSRRRQRLRDTGCYFAAKKVGGRATISRAHQAQVLATADEGESWS